MGAFCVYGISKGLCKATAAKKTSGWDKEEKRSLSMAEWTSRRDALAAQLFADGARRTKVSPEFDAPQFCRDWLAVSPGEVKLAMVMVRGPKVDKKGKPVMRGGAQVLTWLEYEPQVLAA
jgi:hypothetical protein